MSAMTRARMSAAVADGSGPPSYVAGGTSSEYSDRSAPTVADRRAAVSGSTGPVALDRRRVARPPTATRAIAANRRARLSDPDPMSIDRFDDHERRSCDVHEQATARTGPLGVGPRGIGKGRQGPARSGGRPVDHAARVQVGVISRRPATRRSPTPDDGRARRYPPAARIESTGIGLDVTIRT